MHGVLKNLEPSDLAGPRWWVVSGKDQGQRLVNFLSVFSLALCTSYLGGCYRAQQTFGNRGFEDLIALTSKRQCSWHLEGNE